MLNVLLAIAVVGGLVLMARSIDWRDLWPDEKAAASSGSRTARGAAPAERREGRPAPSSPAPSGTTPATTIAGNQAAESVHDLKQKIEELAPATDDAPPPAAKSRPVVAPPPAEHATEPAPPSAAAPAPPTRRAAERAELGVDRIEKRSVEEAGFVAIDSYAAARIYVDGQFSGTTPRTVKLVPGDHQIKLIADGYEDWARRVRLKGSQQIGIKASMKKKAVQP